MKIKIELDNKVYEGDVNESTPIIQPIPKPEPIPSLPTPTKESIPTGIKVLTLNDGNMNFKDHIGPGSIKYYAFVMPEGKEYGRISMSSIDQIANVNMIIKRDSIQDIELCYDSAIKWYKANLMMRNGQLYTDKNPPSVYAHIDEASPNESISIKNLPAGTYYVMLKNESKTRTAAFFIYAGAW